MNCYKCDNFLICNHPKYAYENNFTIEDCKNFSLSDCYKYMKIAKNEELLLLIYNYFTGEEELYSLYDKEEIEETIRKAIKNL